MKPPEDVEAGVGARAASVVDAEIERLIQELNTVRECDQAAAKLVWHGPKAIPALKRFLFEGRVSVVYQPRQAAIEALGGLGAKDVLLQYLLSKREIEDAATRFAEQSVKNAAARELVRWRTKDVLDALLSFALPRSQPGIVEALGYFASLEAVPYLVHALEDDLCQAAAIEGLRKIGRDAEMALVSSALIRLPSSDEERPSSRRRRTKSLELLAKIGRSPDTWPLLRPLLEDGDPGIIAAVAAITATLGTSEDRTAAVDRLLGVLPSADWFLREEIQNRLVELYPEAGPRIDEEIGRRKVLSEAERIMDPLFRVLLSVRRRAEQEGNPRERSI